MHPYTAWSTLLACARGSSCDRGLRRRAVTGPATSSAHLEARSALTFVDNVDLLDPLGTYRRWTVHVVEAPEGTDCETAGSPLVAIELYTIFSSAPRGLIRSRSRPATRLFPAAYATVIDGINVQGEVMITAAATTILVGTLTGYATIDGSVRTLDVTFDAPTCTP